MTDVDFKVRLSDKQFHSVNSRSINASLYYQPISFNPPPPNPNLISMFIYQLK